MKHNFIKTLVIAFLCLSACKESNNKESETSNQQEQELVQDTISEQFGGLALYTIRDTIKSNPKKVLQAVADMGYQYIEDAGYSDRKFYGMSPANFKSLLNEVNLDPVSSHQGGINFENVDTTIADVKEAGFEYLVIPVPPMGMFKVDPETRQMGMDGRVEKLTEVLNTIGKKCNDAGLQLLYHNHDFEFMKNEEGIIPIDYLLENTDPEIVNFEIDLYWATKAGADPMAYFDNYPNRFKAWHVKDMDAEGRFARVGNGQINFDEILSKKEGSGMEFYFVEQDKTFDGMSPMEAIAISHDALESIGFR